jgi:OMF family outer membrane factor
MSRKLGAGEEEQRAMGGSGTKRLLARWMPAGLALGLGLGSGPGQALPAASAGDGRRLERRSSELDRQIRTLEQLLLPEAEPLTGGALASPSLKAADTAPLLALPEAGSLGEGQPQAPSLERTLAIGLTNSPTLQARREEVAAAPAELQSQMGTSWPRFSAYADSGTDQASTSFFSPTGRGTLFSSSNPFFVPPGGRGSLNVNENAAAAGQQLRYELLDFARTPKARSALADQAIARRRLAALHNLPPQLPPLEATVNVNITYAQRLRERLPMPSDPNAPVPARLQ